MADNSVVVIGAGVGGLVSAALLAARGLDVTVVEAAATPGGKLRQIEGVDAGPTVFTLREVFEEVFAACGQSLDDAMAARPATVLARHGWSDGSRLDLHADATASEAAIGDFAGAAEARGYRRFRAEAKRLFEALDRPFLRAGKADPLTLGWRMGLRSLPDYLHLRAYASMWRALGGYFRDPRLRQLFGRYATYAGSSPFATPATLMLIAHVEARGVWLIEGGMYRLALALEELARRKGARFRYGVGVRDVLVERGRAAGVTLDTGERLDAGAVVCNADPAAIGAGRFGKAARRAVAPVPARRRSLSAMVWTGRATANGFPLTRHNVFFSDDYQAEFAALARGHLAESPSVYLCAQDRRDAGDLCPSLSGEGFRWALSSSPFAGGRAPPPTPPLKGRGEERVQIIVNAPATGDGAPLTQAEIDRCTAAMRRSLSRAGCSLALAAEAVLTTPHDFDRLFPSTGGALYGPASHGWAASFRRQGSRTRIPGLYCAGGSTHPGAGVPMAALSGRLAAASLLRDRASTSVSTRTAMRGGMSTPPPTTAATA